MDFKVQVPLENHDKTLKCIMLKFLKTKKLTKKDPLKFFEITLQEEDEDQEEVEKEGEGEEEEKEEQGHVDSSRLMDQ